MQSVPKNWFVFHIRTQGMHVAYKVSRDSHSANIGHSDATFLFLIIPLTGIK